MEPQAGGKVLEEAVDALEPGPHCLRRPPPLTHLEKGTEIKPRFLALIWVGSEGWGREHWPATEQTMSWGSKCPC